GLALGPNKLELIGRERFYGYIACTRARERLVLTCAAQDSEAHAKNPSPLFSLIEQLFPALPLEPCAPEKDWFESEHQCELIAPLVQAQNAGEKNNLTALAEMPLFASLQKPLAHFASISKEEILSPQKAEELYGTTLKTSVSLLEQYAACPFRFFVSAGLRAQERRVFEVDVREKGSFQHAVLAKFHEQLRDENKRWRDLSPDQARKRIGSIGAELKLSFRDGLFGSDAQSDFSAQSMVESLQNFIETIIEWMQQYNFNPHLVELGFGAGEKSLPAWEINLDERHKLALRGIIDRVDLFHMPETNEALAVIMDYKSSAKQLDPVLLANGLQLQLLAYLAFLRHLPDPENLFGAKRLIPAGVFFVNLRGNYSGGKTRNEVLNNLKDSRQTAFQHTGRFDFTTLAQLDNRNEKTGTQFNYRLKADGQPHGASREILATENFLKLLDDVETHLAKMGEEIFSGMVKIDPYQKGKMRACHQCDYAQICRIDPWTHAYRVLK
ncbi:MAG: PD-(D/E)XK nuclease family protein, partial [Verrucomicrobiota bacterium]